MEGGEIILGILFWVILIVIFYLVFLRVYGGDEETVQVYVPEEKPQEEIQIKQEPLRVIIEDEVADTKKWATDIFFDKDDPQDWHQYHGQEKVKRFLQLQIDVVPPDEGLKVLLIASKGQGKTTLFRIIGKKMLKKRGGRYIEITPAMLKSKKQIDELLGQIQTGDIICLDEVHMLGRNNADLLLPAIEDGVHPFDDGMRRLPPGITWIGATTDAGLLPEAFQDRFNTVALSPLTEEDSIAILKDMRFEIDEMPAKEIAVRSVGSPRELKRVFKVCRDVATSLGKNKIDEDALYEACDLLELDTNGLYVQDRQVLYALYNNPKFYAVKSDGTRPKRYAHSERAIRAFTGIDESMYRDQVEPKLLQQGFITIGSAGRELTRRTFEEYFPDHPLDDPAILG